MRMNRANPKALTRGRKVSNPTVSEGLKTLTASKAKASFSALLTDTGYRGQRIVIKKGTRAVSVMIGYDDFQGLVDLEDRYQSALLTKSLKEDRYLDLDEVTRHLGL